MHRPLSYPLTVLMLSMLFMLFSGTLTAGEKKQAPLDERVDRLESEMVLLRRDVAALRELLERQLGAKESTEESSATPSTDEIRDGIEDLVAESESLGDRLDKTQTAVGALSQTERRRNQLSVYGTFTALSPEGEDSTFDAEAFEIVLSGRPSSRLGFFAEIEFERSASVGGERGGEVLLEQAFASFTLSPWANLRAGVLLVPFGNFNVDHYAPTRDVISKPLVSYVVTPSDWTDNGLGVQGGTLVGDLWSFDYEVYLISGLDQDVTGLGTRAARQPFGEDNNDNKAITGHFSWNRLGALELGTSIYSGKYDDEGRLGIFGWGVDAIATSGRWVFTGEYDHFAVQQSSGRDARLEGWYARAMFDLAPDWLRRGKHGTAFPSAKLALVGQYDHVRLTGPIDGVTETNSERRATLGLTYRPTHHWVLKLNVEDSEAVDRPLRDGNRRAYLGSIGFQF